MRHRLVSIILLLSGVACCYCATQQVRKHTLANNSRNNSILLAKHDGKANSNSKTVSTDEKKSLKNGRRAAGKNHNKRRKVDDTALKFLWQAFGETKANVGDLDDIIRMMPSSSKKWLKKFQPSKNKKQSRTHDHNDDKEYFTKEKSTKKVEHLEKAHAETPNHRKTKIIKHYAKKPMEKSLKEVNSMAFNNEHDIEKQLTLVQENLRKINNILQAAEYNLTTTKSSEPITFPEKKQQRKKLIFNVLNVQKNATIEGTTTVNAKHDNLKLGSNAIRLLSAQKNNSFLPSKNRPLDDTYYEMTVIVPGKRGQAPKVMSMPDYIRTADKIIDNLGQQNSSSYVRRRGTLYIPRNVKATKNNRL